MLVAQPTQWPSLTEIVGHPELVDDPRYADPQSMAENAKALTALLEGAFGSQPLAHWEERFDQERITYGVIQTPEEAADDPQLRANDIVVPLRGDDEMKEIISGPITVRGLRKAHATRAPELGEHTEEVLQELGFSRREVERFRARGAIPGAAERKAA
jgi:crotonobetainyl-CoA:carnitine CoA-transferase CaiB-like acyl-CoA transferase